MTTDTASQKAVELPVHSVARRDSRARNRSWFDDPHVE
jgi:hypothetical protein